MFNKARIKLYNKWFCKQFIKRSLSIGNYDYYLKHCSKKDSLPSSFCEVALYDVIDNNGMNKLIKSIYKIKRQKKLYRVHTPYIYSKHKKRDYINSNINKIITGIIAEITFKSHKWIHSISINYTYLNPSQCLIQYTFRFQKVISTITQIHSFVVDEIKKCRKELYFYSYADKSMIKTASYKHLLELDGIFFDDILQSFICKMFYTDYGKQYSLPIEYCMKIHKYNNHKRNKLRRLFLCAAYEQGTRHIIIPAQLHNRFKVFCYNSGKYFPRPSFLNYFTYFSTEIYYMAFNHIEMIELEIKMRKYLNSRKRFISSKDLKWFINRIRNIKQQKAMIERSFTDTDNPTVSEILKWKLYYRGKEQKGSFINFPEHTDIFLNQYEQNLDYLNSIASVQNNLLVIIIAVATLIATIVGIIITLFCNMPYFEACFKEFFK